MNRGEFVISKSVLYNSYSILWKISRSVKPWLPFSRMNRFRTKLIYLPYIVWACDNLRRVVYYYSFSHIPNFPIGIIIYNILLAVITRRVPGLDLVILKQTTHLGCVHRYLHFTYFLWYNLLWPKCLCHITNIFSIAYDSQNSGHIIWIKSLINLQIVKPTLLQ